MAVAWARFTVGSHIIGFVDIVGTFSDWRTELISIHNYRLVSMPADK